jgi:plasmid stabilization system protein ParE
MTGARRELDRAFDFYDGIDEALAVRIVTRIEAKANWLGAFPTTGAPFATGLRKSLVSGTPFLIIYRVRSTAVEILRVRHAAEDWR